ncbi:uncharacterized protein [Hemitrygon akajei]|uniref:uncharacterized protein n=1 Tax=Hemitrygon akajei TaxID=2704970 RepID=UPI003BFA226D
MKEEEHDLSVKMDKIEERLSEEVRKYVHLYDSSSPDYKDCQMASNSWKEISKTLGLDVMECTKKWKNLRDKYVRVRKRLSKRSGDPGGKRKVPAFYFYLSWLAPHIKHRETDSNYDDNKDGNDSASGLSTSSVAEENQPPDNPSSRAESSSSRESSPVHPQPPPVTPTPSPLTSSPRIAQKRKRKQHDVWFEKQVAQWDERRVELQRRLLQENDELSRFGQTVADMLRRLPEKHRPQAMFDVHKLLFERQQQKQ